LDPCFLGRSMCECLFILGSSVARFLCFQLLVRDVQLLQVISQVVVEVFVVLIFLLDTLVILKQALQLAPIFVIIL